MIRCLYELGGDLISSSSGNGGGATAAAGAAADPIIRGSWDPLFAAANEG